MKIVRRFLALSILISCAPLMGMNLTGLFVVPGRISQNLEELAWLEKAIKKGSMSVEKLQLKKKDIEATKKELQQLEEEKEKRERAFQELQEENLKQLEELKRASWRRFFFTRLYSSARESDALEESLFLHPDYFRTEAEAAFRRLSNSPGAISRTLIFKGNAWKVREWLWKTISCTTPKGTIYTLDCESNLVKCVNKHGIEIYKEGIGENGNYTIPPERLVEGLFLQLEGLRPLIEHGPRQRLEREAGARAERAEERNREELLPPPYDEAIVFADGFSSNLRLKLGKNILLLSLAMGIAFTIGRLSASRRSN